MSNIIQHKRNATPGAIPTTGNLSYGELGINYGDGKLYIKNSNDEIINLGVTTVSGTHIFPASGTLNTVVFNNVGDPDLITGQLGWNNSEGTLALGLSNNYEMFLGGELHYRVRNNTGSTILAGTAVYATGLTPGGNNRIEIAPNIADGSIREVRFMGLMTEDCNTGVDGFTTHFGYIRGIDTRGDASANGTTNKLWDTDEPAWYEGDILYVHPTVAGKLTKIEPKHGISVAIILNKHQNQGKLFVRPTSYGHLNDNHDVDTSNVMDNQYLRYDSATDYWVPTSSGVFNSLSVSNDDGSSISLLDTDIDIYANQVLKLDGETYISLNSVANANVGIGTENPTTLLDVSGVITATGGNSNNWNTAYGWGNHASAGYQSALTNPVTGTGAANYIAYWNNSSGQAGNSNLLWDNINKQLQIGTVSSSGTLYVHGSGYFNDLNALGYVIDPESPYGERISGTIKTHKLIVDSYVASGPTDGPAGSIDIISAGGGKTITLTCENYPINNSTFIFPDVSGSYTVVAKDTNGDFSAGTIAATLNGNASTVTNGVYTTGNQTISGVKTFAGRVESTSGPLIEYGSRTPNGNIHLSNNVCNYISFNSSGVGIPDLYSRSLGTKILLSPSPATANADTSIGIENNGLWLSVPNTSYNTKFYAGAVNTATLTGSGVLTIQGGTSQINVDNLRLDGNTLSATNGSLFLNPSGTSSIFLGNAGLIEFRPSSNRFIMSDSGPEIICDFNESSCLFRKSSGAGATVGLFIDRSSSTATIGINTNTPSEALDVDGTIKAKSLNIGSSNTLNVANTYGSIIGGYQSKASMYGEIAHAAGGFASVNGTAQHTILVARGITLSGAFTVTIASPAVFTRNGHSLSVGDTVTLSTTGSLPTGLNTTTTYYVISSGLTGSTFQLSTTLNGAAINTSGTQSGTHTLLPTTSLTLNGATGLTTRQLMIIPPRSTWTFTVKISSYNSQDNQGASWWAAGGLRRNNTTTIELENATGLSFIEGNYIAGLLSIQSDTVNNALDLRVTGILNKSLRWVAVIDICQVSYGTP